MIDCAEPQTQAAAKQETQPGIQPIGFLLALSSDWRVSCASANLATYTGIDAADILGRPVSSFLTPESVHLIRNRVALLRGEDSSDRLIDRQLAPGGAAFDAILRQSAGEVILEAVPGTDPGGIDVAGSVERMLQRVERLTDVASIAESATRELRGLTGFDAIQIYRNTAGAPERVASFVRSGLSAFEPANVRPAALRQPLWVANSASDPVAILCSGDGRQMVRPALLAMPEPGLAGAIERTGAKSAVLLPIAGAGEACGFVLALHRTARAPRVARLSVAELFAHILALRLEAMDSATRASR